MLILVKVGTLGINLKWNFDAWLYRSRLMEKVRKCLPCLVVLWYGGEFSFFRLKNWQVILLCWRYNFACIAKMHIIPKMIERCISKKWNVQESIKRLITVNARLQATTSRYRGAWNWEVSYITHINAIYRQHIFKKLCPMFYFVLRWNLVLVWKRGLQQNVS